MRSRSPLVLMAQLVMVLVFALAAALCLQAFAFADRVSARNEAVDRAVVECQRVAETLKSVGLTQPDVDRCLDETAQILHAQSDQGVTWIDYDENWNIVDEWETEAVYRLSVQEVTAPVDGMWKFAVAVSRHLPEDADSGTLFRLYVAWAQEVSSRG